MPFWLAEQFAYAWDKGRFRVALLDDEENDVDDWIRFRSEETGVDVYVRFLDKTLTLTTPASTHYLNIKMGSIADVVRMLADLTIKLKNIQYKYVNDVFFQETYQFVEPRVTYKTLEVTWQSTNIPDVPKWAFDCGFKLNGCVDDHYPPAPFPDVWDQSTTTVVDFFEKHHVIQLPK